MAKSQVKTFKATLEHLPGGLQWVIIRIPFDVKKTWTKMNRLRVRGDVNGVEFRSSAFPLRQGGHFLLVNKKLRAAAGINAGSAARVRIEPDLAERSAITPAELQKFLNQHRSFRKWYDALPYSLRKEVAQWIEQPESAASQARRAEQMAERLLATMEGERETPPVLRAALARNARARSGWEMMTLAMRRRVLLAISSYRSPEAQMKRVEKVIAYAECRAERPRDAESTDID